MFINIRVLRLRGKDKKSSFIELISSRKFSRIANLVQAYSNQNSQGSGAIFFGPPTEKTSKELLKPIAFKI